MPLRYPVWIIVGEPHFASGILVYQRLQGQIDAGDLVRLHQWGAAARVAKNQKFSRAQLHADGGGTCRMIDAREH